MTKKKKLKKSKKVSRNNTKNETRTDWPTMQDVRRYSAWFGAALVLAALVVSFWTTVMVLAGFAFILGAFEEKIRTKLKR